MKTGTNDSNETVKGKYFHRTRSRDLSYTQPYHGTMNRRRAWSDESSSVATRKISNATKIKSASRQQQPSTISEDVRDPKNTSQSDNIALISDLSNSFRDLMKGFDCGFTESIQREDSFTLKDQDFYWNLQSDSYDTMMGKQGIAFSTPVFSEEVHYWTESHGSRGSSVGSDEAQILEGGSDWTEEHGLRIS